jgi:hypothetical protein
VRRPLLQALFDGGMPRRFSSAAVSRFIAVPVSKTVPILEAGP